jgi:hypothetical protein
MISPLDVYRARKHWDCGWFVAWTRLRCRRAYWDGTQAQQSVVGGADPGHEARRPLRSRG